MDNELLERLLRQLPQRGIDKARPSLADDVKNRIPHRLIAHRLDTINIIVDLRISKLAAAAAIVATMVLLAGFLGLRGSPQGHIYEDGKLFLKYCLGGENAYKSDALAGLSKFYQDLYQQGKEVVYYADRANLADSYAVLMHWKLPDGRYGVIFGDLTARTISPDTLIMLQSRMLQEKPK